MRKILQKGLIFFFFGICMFTFAGCEKKQNIDTVSKKLDNYSIEASYNESEKLLTASQTIDYTNRSSTALSCINLQLYANAYKEKAKFKVVSDSAIKTAYPNGLSYGEIKIKKASVNEDQTLFNIAGEDNNILCVPLKKELYPDEKVSIYLEYEVKLANIRHRLGYSNDTVNFAHFYPVVCKIENGKFLEIVYSPCGDPFYGDMLNFNVAFTTNKNMVLAGSGKVVSEVINGDEKTTIFKQNAIRDFAVVASKKFKVDTVKVEDTTINYVYYKDENNQESAQTAKDAITFFSNSIGKYPYETFTVVQSAFNQAGMEYGTLVVISDEIKNEEDYRNVIIHETAHQWWYNLVGNNQVSESFLDEGLTEYFTALFYKNHPSYNVNFNELMSNVLQNYVVFEEIYTSVGARPDGNMLRTLYEFKTEPEYSFMIYVKGSLMFHSLNEVLGDKNFDKAIKEYFNANQFKIATKDDMVFAFQKATNIKLDTFFDAWLNGKVSILAIN